MENGIWNEITSFVLGILTGVLTGILTSIVRTHYEMWKRRKENEEAKRKARPVNVLEDHSGEIKKAVSFGDDEAIVVEPLMQYGKPILIANLNMSNAPQDYNNVVFVMAFLEYLPLKNWSCFSELDYQLVFKIRGNINGVQLEIKDEKKRKIIDEYIKITDTFEKKTVSLRNRQLSNISEVCFTIFNENKYIQKGGNGKFEMFDFWITNE